VPAELQRIAGAPGAPEPDAAPPPAGRPAEAPATRLDRGAAADQLVAVREFGPAGFVVPPRLVAILGAVVAPTTLLTALLYYFGWSHAYWFFHYFGVDSSLLGFTSTDYLMRSVDALFVPMTVAATAGLLLIWGHVILRARLSASSRRRARRVLLPAAAVAGGGLAAGGLASVFTRTVLSDHLVAAPLSLGVGVLLLAAAAGQVHAVTGADRPPARGRPAAEWAVVFVLVGLSLFWAATDYSAAVGRARARDFVAHLPSYPDVVIYSQRSLSLTAPGVRATRCPGPQVAYRFRYDGLKLVLQSGDQYLFVPAAWTPVTGAAILIPRGSSLRLEFYPASARPWPASSPC
jgi:hypothetical protein